MKTALTAGPRAALNRIKIANKDMTKWENSLYKKGQKYLQSRDFKKAALKIAQKFDLPDVIPEMVPVFLNKRLKRYGGFYFPAPYAHIEINYSDYRNGSDKAHGILKHEVVHLFVDHNFNAVQNQISFRKFERLCIVAFGHNGHGAFKWKYSCECGHWIKTNEKRKIWHCPKCGKIHVPEDELEKLRQIAEIDSKCVVVHIERYHLLREEEIYKLDN